MFSLFNGGCGYIPEMEQIISHLERGTLVTKYSWRKKAESKILAIRRETRQITWTRPTTGTNGKQQIDGSIDLRKVKEIRLGKCSKDFDKCPDLAKDVDNLKCFVVYHGTEFKLRALSIAALSEEECERWRRGLHYLVTDTIEAPYPLQVQAWLRREFYAIDNGSQAQPEKKVNLKDVKGFLPRLSYKCPTIKLREVFNEVDTTNRTEIGFDDFAVLYQKLLLDEKNAHQLFDKLSVYSSDLKTIKLHELQKFFRHEQNDKMGNDERAVSKFMCEFLKDDPEKNVADPSFTIAEFLDYLFSKQNDLWDDANDEIYQDMTQPLSHYWIASSHNTYLTGDQLSSMSSVEAYVRCLRMGCRCIELDCWDGPERMPFIYHGHTLTTKIKFLDVINTIKEHAFATSDFPVILSIEDNCSLPQQRKMAQAMQDVFGDMLLVQPVDRNERQLPSPLQLRRKIILKHKKLPEGQDELSFVVRTSDNELDLRNSVKNGIMYLEDPIDKEWTPHLFILTQTRLFYTDSYKMDQESERSEDEDDSSSSSSSSTSSLQFQKHRSEVPNEELHFGEKWFHGRLAKGRDEAEHLLRMYADLGDGTFLVRASVTFVGDYCLSFLRDGVVKHCRIRWKPVEQKYYLTDTKYFDSVYRLITYYRSNPLVTPEFSIILNEPVPQPKKHETEEWYHKLTGKTQAEDILKNIRTEGAFLVRPSQYDSNCYTISFRADKKIKHCRIKLEGRLYTIGTVEFESLVDLVHHYENNPLYRKVKLSLPINEEAVKRIMMEQRDNAAYNNGTPSYMDPSAFTPAKVTVKALYDYRSDKSSDLSFCKHAIITNVTKPENTPGWWKGDYGGLKQHYFPENYVVEINPIEPAEFAAADGTSGDNTLHGNYDMNGAVVDLISYPERQELKWTLRIVTSTACAPVEVSVKSDELARDWLSHIKDVAKIASALENQNREMERTFRIAQEMSSLIIYCRSITFNIERARQSPLFYEMSSFNENKAEKLIYQEYRDFFVKYHRSQFSRIYPKPQRIDSSNYSPINLWNCGSQMVALNYQTGDKPMQLNQAKFRDNGNCGYLLKPSFMFANDFDPNDPNFSIESYTISMRIIAARHLSRLKKCPTSPFVEVEVLGTPNDSGSKLVTKPIADNGFNPQWTDEYCEFIVTNPHLAFLRFLVQDEDVFGEPNFIGQATYPMTCIRTGYRSVWLRNGFSEELELASLLIHISIKKTLTPS